MSDVWAGPIHEYSSQAVNWWLELDAEDASNEWTIERQLALQHVVSECMNKLRDKVVPALPVAEPLSDDAIREIAVQLFHKIGEPVTFRTLVTFARTVLARAAGQP